MSSISTSTSRPNIHDSKITLCICGWDQKDLVMSCWNLAIPLRTIGIGYNWFVWAVHCEKNGQNTSKDMIKLFFFNAYVTKVIKKYLERSNGMFYHTRRILRTLLLLITVCSEGCSKSSVHFFRRNRKLASKLDRLQRQIIFSRWNSKLAWEMKKSSRQRWTIL